MKCPLLKKHLDLELEGVYDEPLDCLKEECAWWDEDDKQCAVLSLVEEFVLFNLSFVALLDKMPHAEQFKK